MDGSINTDAPAKVTRRRKTRLLATRTLIVAIAVVAVIAAPMWWSSHQRGPELTALRKESMAQFQPAAGTLVHEWQDKQKNQSWAGKGSQASIGRSFAMPNTAIPNALQEAIAAALASGWQPDPNNIHHPESWSGNKSSFTNKRDYQGKPYEQVRMDLSINVNPHYTGGDARIPSPAMSELFLWLRHVGTY